MVRVAVRVVRRDLPDYRCPYFMGTMAVSKMKLSGGGEIREAGAGVCSPLKPPTPSPPPPRQQQAEGQERERGGFGDD